MAKQTIPTKWDLSELYSGIDDPHIEKDLQKLARDAQKFAKNHQGKLKTYNPTQLKKMLQEDERLGSLVHRLSLFVSLVGSLNTLDGAVAALQQKIASKITEIQNTTVFASLELAKHPKLKELGETKIMGPYQIVFQNLLQQKKHQLDASREQLLNTKSIPANAGWQEMFEKLCAKVTVEIPGKSGAKAKRISIEAAIAMLYHADKNQRNIAGAGLTKALQEHEELYTHIYSMVLVDKMQNDQLRNFSNPADDQHLANNLAPAAVEALQAVTNANRSLVSRYYHIKRKLLGLKKLTEYDRYVPLASQSKKAEHVYSFAEGVAKVEDAFQQFDPEFAKHFRTIVDAGHIDALPSPNKRSGAFCADWETSPFILLNYFGRTGDVQTLAHEAGHGIHAILAKDLPLAVRSAPIAMAETASVFAEMIVFQKVFGAAKSNAEKIALLSTKIEENFATIFRQMAMYRFEQLAHGTIKKNGQISAKELQGFWLETQREMFGDSIEIGDGYKYWWQYISHFFGRPFYVYGYSFGGLLVLSLYEAYKREGALFIPKYKRFLALGGSKTPQEALSEFGFDLSDPKFWQAGMEPLREMIDQLEALI